MPINTPTLIVVSGRPGAGKTTLAQRLAQAIRCPAFCRDAFKEGLVRSRAEQATFVDHARRNLQANYAFFAATECVLRAGVTLVIEAAFQNHRWLPQLEPLGAIADIRLIRCTVDPMLAQTRCIERSIADPEWASYHGASVVQPPATSEQPIGAYQPLQLAVPTLAVDTSNGYAPSFDQILAFATR